MKTLIKKELVSLLSSYTALFFSVSFIIASGLMNWVFSGSFNIFNNGYANLSKFFELAIILLIVLIPALTMRSFSEEKNTKNLDIIRSRPISFLKLYLSKLSASWLIVFVSCLASIVYVYTVYVLSIPEGNIDLNEIAACYFSLLIFALLFIVIGLFASSLSNNQVIAFIIALFCNFILFYGFELLSSFTNQGKIQLFISSLGLLSHYSSMQKGVVYIKDLVTIANYIVIISGFTLYWLSLRNKKDRQTFISLSVIIILVNLVFFFIPNNRFDFTSDKKYTLSDYSKNLLEDISQNDKRIEIKIFLDGDLNPGFQRLHDAVKDMLKDFTKLTDAKISYSFINPYTLGSQEQTHAYMAERNMRGIVLNETDNEGKTSQKIIYPDALLISGQDTLQVDLLKNITGYSAEENLNASIENLEFEFIDAVRLLNQKEANVIAFIEGHNEIPRAYVYDAEEQLSKYFFVNRGQIGNDVSELQDFKVIIIAGPTEKFSEKEKFIIDQYIMSGGSVFWLIDGVYLSQEELAGNGKSPAIKNETNLDYMLFNYGVRINPVLLQDAQCSSIILTSGKENPNGYTEQPWFYSPLLLPSENHPVTKDISLVKALFASSIDITDKNKTVDKNILLTSSMHSHSIQVPEMVSLDVSLIQSDPEYFKESFLTAGIALEGIFKSTFTNRAIPDSVEMHGKEALKTSTKTKMIVVSSSDVIRNEVVTYDNEPQILPMGYDKISGRQFGNRDFIINAVNWLANDSDWSVLKSKQQQIRILNKQLVYNQRNAYMLVNTLAPLIFIALLFGGFSLLRKCKYQK